MTLRTSSIVFATIATMLILGASSIGFANAEVQVGNFSVSEAAAAYQEVPELACKLADAIYGNLIQSQPVDWEQVQELYEESGENIPFSPQQLAQGAVFGDSPPEILQEYQQFYGYDTWLDTFVCLGIIERDPKSASLSLIRG